MPIIAGNPQAPDWYTPEYQTQVRLQYQAKGYELRGAVTPPVKIDGEKMYFPFMGEGAAYEVNRNDASNPDNVEYSLVEQTWKHYEYQFAVNQVDLDKTTIGMVQGYAGVTARALGRKHTRVILASLEAEALPGDQIVGSYAAGLDLDAVAEAITRLYDNVEDDSEMAVCPLPHRAFSQLMTYKEFASADYVGTADLPFVKKSSMKIWRNCLFFTLPLRKGKPDPYFRIQNNTELDFHMWVPSSVGSGGLGDQVRSYVTWDNKRQGGGWDHKNVIGIGAKVLQAKGLVRLRMKSDSAIEFATPAGA